MPTPVLSRSRGRSRNTHRQGLWTAGLLLIALIGGVLAVTLTHGQAWATINTSTNTGSDTNSTAPSAPTTEPPADPAATSPAVAF